MAITSDIDPLNPTRSVREILAQWLGDYFDGSSHTIGAESETFPDCDIIPRFVLPSRELPKPIVGIRIGDSPTAEYRNDRGKIQRSMIQCYSYAVSTSGIAGGIGAAQRQCDLISDLIRALLVWKAHEPGAHGMRRRAMGDAIAIENPDAGPDYWCRMRSVSFQVDLEL